MDPLHKQAIVQGLFGIVFFIILIFWPAGTFDYWQGWLFLGIFSASTVGFTVYLAIYDRPLLERRMKAGPQYEREWSQKIIVSLVFLTFFALIVVSALDHRYAWSPVAPGVSILGNVVILLSFLSIFWVIRVNSFAVQHPRGEGSERDRHGPVRARAPSDVRWRHLAVRRNAARARFVVAARTHPAFRAGAFVAASRRGENPAERFTRVYGLHAPGTLSSGSVRVVEATRRDLEESP